MPGANNEWEDGQTPQVAQKGNNSFWLGGIKNGFMDENSSKLGFTMATFSVTSGGEDGT
jgi:hypothetical protein